MIFIGNVQYLRNLLHCDTWLISRLTSLLMWLVIIIPFIAVHQTVNRLPMECSTEVCFQPWLEHMYESSCYSFPVTWNHLSKTDSSVSFSSSCWYSSWRYGIRKLVTVAIITITRLFHSRRIAVLSTTIVSPSKKLLCSGEATISLPSLSSFVCCKQFKYHLPTVWY